MKKVFLGLIVIASMASCNKEQCAYCSESVSGTESEYCGEEEDVDVYVQTLYSASSIGQDWSCTVSSK